MATAPKTDQERHPERYFESPKNWVRDRIVIHPTAEIPKDGLFFGLNGIQYLVKAGVELDLPRPVIQMLQTRIRRDTIKGDDGVDYHRDVQRITFTMIKEGCNLPNPVAIAAEDKAQKEAEAPE